jgi:hypothetical protein
MTFAEKQLLIVVKIFRLSFDLMAQYLQYSMAITVFIKDSLQ